MTAKDTFNKKANPLVIFRGDCTRRGYKDGPAIKEGGRFDLVTLRMPFTYVAEKITVKTCGEITADDNRRNINPNAVTPLIPSDVGPMKPDEPCTVVEFSLDSKKLIPVNTISFTKS